MSQLKCDTEKLDFGLVTATNDGRHTTSDHDASQTFEISSPVGGEDATLNIACFPSWLDCRFSEGKSQVRLMSGKAVRVLVTLRDDPRPFLCTRSDDAILITTTLEEVPYIAIPTNLTVGENLREIVLGTDKNDEPAPAASQSQGSPRNPIVKTADPEDDPDPPVVNNDPPPRVNLIYEVSFFLMLVLVALLLWAITSTQAKRIANDQGRYSWRFPDLETAGATFLDEAQLLTLSEQPNKTGLHRGDLIFHNGRYVGKIGTKECRVQRDKGVRTEIIVCRVIPPLGGWTSPLVAAKVLVDNGSGLPIAWSSIAVPDYSLGIPLSSNITNRLNLRNQLLHILSFVLGLFLVAGAIFYGTLCGSQVSANTMFKLSFLGAILGLIFLPEVSLGAFIYRLLVNTVLVWVSARGITCLLCEYGQRNTSFSDLTDGVLPANWV